MKEDVDGRDEPEHDGEEGIQEFQARNCAVAMA